VDERVSDPHDVRVMPTRADVVIAGAGPAGTTLAGRLARRGIDVALLDAAEFPREKLCGEFYSPEVIDSVRALGLEDALHALAPAIVERARFHGAFGHVATTAFDPPGFGLPRSAFDEILRREAVRCGATWWPRRRVVAVERTGDRVRALVRWGAELREVEARVVVDATGHGAALRATVGSAGELRSWVGVRARVAGGEEEARRCLEVHPFPGGYLGVAPVAGGEVNLCALVRSADVRAQSAGPAAVPAASQGSASVRPASRGSAGHGSAGLQSAHVFQGNGGASVAERTVRDGSHPGVAILRAIVHRVPELARRYADRLEDAHVITTSRLRFGWRGPPGAALPIGDAAGAVPPVVGNGIAMAIRSAEIAEPLLTRYLAGHSSWDETLHHYVVAWHREFARRARVARLAHEIAVRPAALRWASLVSLGASGLFPWLVRETRGAARARGGAARHAGA